MSRAVKLLNLGKQCRMGHMSPSQPEPAAADAADAAEILRAITRISYLITRARRHDRVRSAAAVPLDRAAVMVLGQLAEAGPARPGELADRLGGGAPHAPPQARQQPTASARPAPPVCRPPWRTGPRRNATSSPPCCTAWSMTSSPTPPKRNTTSQHADHQHPPNQPCTSRPVSTGPASPGVGVSRYFPENENLMNPDSQTTTARPRT